MVIIIYSCAFKVYIKQTMGPLDIKPHEFGIANKLQDCMIWEHIYSGALYITLHNLSRCHLLSVIMVIDSHLCVFLYFSVLLLGHLQKGPDS